MEWHPDYREEMRRRLQLRNDLLEDDKLRAQFLKYYSTHPVDWINDWCVTFDPRAVKPKPKLMPFVLFPRQVEFVHFIMGCLNEKEGGLVEKSRDMGATWLCCAISVWLWLFQPGTVVGWGSLKEISVDKRGDPKAIFPKMRQILEYLPAFMMPRGFKPSAHDTYMKLENPITGCTIIGEGGDSMGRGGRTTIYFKDESAHYAHPELIEAALGDNTDVQIDMSSVNGSANVFYRRRMAGQIWYPEQPPIIAKTRVFIFDWRDNPLKSQEWYDRRRKKAEDEGLLHVFAQEVDRDYCGSVERIIINPVWVRAAIDAHIKLGFNDSGARIAGQDVADEGGDKNALAIRHGVVLRHCDHWGGAADDAAFIAIPIAREHGCTEFYYDSPGVGSGFKAGINSMKKENKVPATIRIFPWNGGAAVLDPLKNIIPGDKESPKNEDHYYNLKAQAWFRLRARFYKTFRAVVHGEKFDPADLISLDSTMERLHELMMELSQPTHDQKLNGKTIVDKKPDGALSPNLADAVNICYCPCRPPKGFFS